VTLRARWVTLRARWVTLRARWVTLIDQHYYGVADAATDNTEERVFLLNFHFLMKRGNYSLLSRAEYECADNDGFLLDVASTVRPRLSLPQPSLHSL
jgi:hypothetical protein